jgi:dTDP-4-dehydrorhamnose reductase
VIRVLVTGSRGQVGAEVARSLAARAEVIAHERSTLDLARPDEMRALIRAARPDAIVNAAAYTAVDRAESDRDAARAVNAEAPGVIAEEARRAGALLVHYSTDYVFDGASPRPYVEGDAPHPLNVYGETKLAGERAIEASGAAHVILRTSWVYGPAGRNFLLTILSAAATKPELRVVDDQRGAPTSNLALARATVEILSMGGAGAIDADTLAAAKERSGLYHASARGETTWHGFAQAILERRARRGDFRMPTLIAIPTREYPTPARRPANSMLSNAKLEAAFGVRLADWREGLDEVFSVLPSG